MPARGERQTITFSGMGAQLVDGDVDVDDLVGTAEEAVGDGFANLRAGRAGDRVIKRLEVLDVHGGHDVDAGVEELQDILVALAVARARHIAVGQLIDDAPGRMAGENGLDVHFAQGDGAVLDFLERDGVKALDERGSVGAAVGFDEADDDVHALTAHEVGVFEHAVGFADAGGGAEIDAETAWLRSVAMLRGDVGRDGRGDGRRCSHPTSTG